MGAANHDEDDNPRLHLTTTQRLPHHGPAQACGQDASQHLNTHAGDFEDADAADHLDEVESAKP